MLSQRHNPLAKFAVIVSRRLVAVGSGTYVAAHKAHRSPSPLFSIQHTNSRLMGAALTTFPQSLLNDLSFEQDLGQQALESAGI